MNKRMPAAIFENNRQNRISFLQRMRLENIIENDEKVNHNNHTLHHFIYV